MTPRAGARPPEGDGVPLHRLDVPAPAVLPFAVGSFDTIGPLSRAAFPHRHTFYEIVYVTGGTGHHVVDGVPLPLLPPHLGVVAPGQVHHWEGVSRLRGWVVLFNPDFLLVHPGDRDLLDRLGTRLWPHLDGDDAASLAAVVLEMRREFTARAEGHVSVLQSLLHVLLAKAVRLPGPAPAGPGAGRGGDVARAFSRMLEEPDGVRASVAELADRLGVSPGHLADVVKRATGVPPGRLLRDARTLEAKRLLTASGLTIGQVALAAGFTDPAYFCRFFRRETGLSPGDFRRAVRTGRPVPRPDG
ncbi:AraC family transcriptional regulator [Streptomyces sp. TRM 70351]|uniref:AraC family transcriptional regulator n=1 Tax=Streptomyces sp. TRM 70351 TaxID=3116552 RepID=UPI002E7B8E5F|nr:AraC family transcriptional regulator [Streptomyces sp. TRM 70351]MEE1927322.1 AraC family transcriptional regulator [Streptomyces sp. TRM 70351]